MLRLELSQLTHERIELGVRNHRVVEHEVPVVVIVELRAQLLHTSARVVLAVPAAVDLGAAIPPRLRETPRVERGILIAVWVTLPITAGGLAADALDDWSTAPQVVASVLVWTAWAAALLAIVIPRPIGLTALRAIAPLFAVLALIAAIDRRCRRRDQPHSPWSPPSRQPCSPPAPAIAFAAVNAIAYGDEERYPLRVPPALFLGPLPLARLALGAAVVAGPLLLADERWILGAVVLAIGLPVAVLAARALHGLSERWAVLVPAGFVVVDPLTLSDPGALRARAHRHVARRTAEGAGRRDGAGPAPRRHAREPVVDPGSARRAIPRRARSSGRGHHARIRHSRRRPAPTRAS